MSDFRTRRLDELMTAGEIYLGRGDVISKDDIANHPGPYPIYSSSAQNNGLFGAYGKFMFDEELISWSVDGGGYFFYRPKHKYSVTNVCGYMRIRPESWHPKFVFYSLVNQHRFLTFDYTSKAHPSVIKKQYHLPTIDVDRQRKIAAILSTIDTAIEQTEALIEKCQHIKTGLMHDLFTRGVLPTGQLRPPREQAPELYQETAIGWVPREWQVAGLASMGRAGTSWIRTGPFGSSLKGEHWRVDGHPVITIGALGTGEFINSELLFISSKDASRLVDFQLKENDVVFSRVADVGRSVVVRDMQAGWIMSSNLMRIAVNDAVLRPDYLQMQLASDSRVKSQIRASVNSGGRDVANSEVLNRLRFGIPKPDEQDRIIAMANQLSQRMRAEQRKVAKLQTQKLGLMQDLLTGKVAVTVDAAPSEAGA